MITEDYVSFKTAQLLKEKGFDESTLFRFDEDGNLNSDGRFGNYNSLTKFNYIAAPTIQMTMKWLREEYGLHCHIDCPSIYCEWRYAIRDLNKDEWIVNKYDGDKNTYEEACEAAIKYCLVNLI